MCALRTRSPIYHGTGPDGAGTYKLQVVKLSPADDARRAQRQRIDTLHRAARWRSVAQILVAGAATLILCAWVLVSASAG